mmetsp:Transcript_32829/g.102443  ORF Transcript_32829/g.102443 Transcript_32829/m.102443 type:complete len:213 (+) Transcript_32829:129-767(+)
MPPGPLCASSSPSMWALQTTRERMPKVKSAHEKKSGSLGLTGLHALEVGRGVHKVWRPAGEAQPHKPALALGRRIHQTTVALQEAVGLDNLAVGRCEHLPGDGPHVPQAADSDLLHQPSPLAVRALGSALVAVLRLLTLLPLSLRWVLHALNRSQHLLALETRAGSRELTPKDLAQQALRVVGDAQDGGVLLNTDPLVRLREAHISGSSPQL